MIDMENQLFVKKVKGMNCVEIILGKKKYVELRKQGAFFLLPEWTKRWEDVFKNWLGLSEKNAADLMQDMHSKIIYIDTGCIPVPYKEIEQISSYCKLPVEIFKADLENLKKLIQSKFHEFEEYNFNSVRTNAYDFLVVDMLERIMKHSHSPKECSDEIALSIRELIGVKTVAVFQHDLLASKHKLLSVLPTRRKNQLHSDISSNFLKYLIAINNIKIQLFEEIPEEIASFLPQESMNKFGIIPLFSGNKRIGTILLLNLYDDHNIEIILDSIKKITGIISIILENAHIIEHLDELVKNRTQELTLSKQRAELITKIVPSGIYTLDLKENITSWNNMCEIITGYSAKEVIGKSFQLLKFQPSRSCSKIFSDSTQIINEECSICCKDGTKKFVLINSDVIFDYKKQVIGAVESFIDITLRKEMQEDIASKTKMLALINQILRHDLANTFSVILSALNLYNKKGDTRMLTEINNHSINGVNLIRNMKQLEKITHEVKELEAIDLKKTVDKNVQGFKNKNFDIKIENATILADIAIDSILQNIFSNAFHHGKATQIIIRNKVFDNKCELHIINNGLPIPDSIKKKIFKEGFKYGRTGNTGLGLYIVYELMKSYQGNVIVTDHKPNGSNFILTFKLA